MNWADDATIHKIFKECRSIAVVGLSSNPARPSHHVASEMQASGCRIIPVNPNETQVLGEPAYPSVTAVPDGVDLVDIFRKSDDVPPIVDEAIAKGVKAVWMQEGVVNEAAAKRAQEAGLLVVMDRCWYKEHQARSSSR
jgi:predicted CoA-binding protein